MIAKTRMLLYLKVHRAKPQRDEPCSAGCAHYRIHRKEYQTYTLVELWVLFGSCIYRSKLCEFERSVALEQNAIQPDSLTTPGNVVISSVQHLSNVAPLSSIAR